MTSDQWPHEWVNAIVQVGALKQMGPLTLVRVYRILEALNDIGAISILSDPKPAGIVVDNQWTDERKAQRRSGRTNFTGNMRRDGTVDRRDHDHGDSGYRRITLREAGAKS